MFLCHVTTRASLQRRALAWALVLLAVLLIVWALG